MNETFAFIRLAGRGRHWQPAYDALSAALTPASVWGVFQGLFGVGANELILVTVGTDDVVAASIETVTGLDPVDSVESLMLVPTVRPTSAEPLTRAGLYVFRFFDVADADVEEIAALSNAAWNTFENTDDYQAQPQALFCQRDRARQRGRMLLLTWYDGLSSWQTSRQPAPEARENFTRRQQLIDGTIAYATRLITS